MKKYSILSLSMLLIGSVCFSQNTASGIAVSGNASKSIEPTINGIPYSQYKAQQEALKTTNQTTATPIGNGVKGAPVLSGQSKSVENNSVPSKPDRQPAVNTPATITEKPVVKPVDVQAPATQTIPAGSFKSSPASIAPVTNSTSAKTVEVNKTNASGTLVIIPAINVAVSDNVEVAKPAATTPQVQQTMTEAKPGQIQEVPNSAASTIPKSPAAKGKN